MPVCDGLCAKIVLFKLFCSNQFLQFLNLNQMLASYSQKDFSLFLLFSRILQSRYRRRNNYELTNTRPFSGTLSHARTKLPRTKFSLISVQLLEAFPSRQYQCRTKKMTTMNILEEGISLIVSCKKLRLKFGARKIVGSNHIIANDFSTRKLSAIF